MRRALITLLVITLAACGGEDDDDSGDAVNVVAGFYPLAWAAEQVGGEHVSVRNLTPAGAAPHDLDLQPPIVEHIEDGAVVLAMGDDFQPAIEDVASRNDGTVEVLDAIDSDNVHAWLDPAQMTEIVSVVEDALIEADPAHASDYAANADALRAELEQLDADFTAGLVGKCDRDLIVTSHDAFDALAEKYSLRQESIAGISPDQEPTPDRLDEL